MHSCHPASGRQYGQSPAFPDEAIGLVVLPVSVHAFPLDHSRPCALHPG